MDKGEVFQCPRLKADLGPMREEREGLSPGEKGER